MRMMLKRYFTVAGAHRAETVAEQIRFQYLRDCRFILNDQNETVIHPNALHFFNFLPRLHRRQTLSRTKGISAIFKLSFGDRAAGSEQGLDRIHAVS